LLGRWFGVRVFRRTGGSHLPSFGVQDACSMGSWLLNERKVTAGYLSKVVVRLQTTVLLLALLCTIYGSAMPNRFYKTKERYVHRI
jgi:hypothetical protein